MAVTGLCVRRCRALQIVEGETSSCAPEFEYSDTDGKRLTTVSTAAFHYGACVIFTWLTYACTVG
jgi:hypothetical protein